MDTEVLSMCVLQFAIISCLAISSASQQEVSHLEATVHQFFQHELKREVYFDKFSLGKIVCSIYLKTGNRQCM